MAMSNLFTIRFRHNHIFEMCHPKIRAGPPVPQKSDRMWHHVIIKCSIYDQRKTCYCVKPNESARWAVMKETKPQALFPIHKEAVAGVSCVISILCLTKTDLRSLMRTWPVKWVLVRRERRRSVMCLWAVMNPWTNPPDSVNLCWTLTPGEAHISCLLSHDNANKILHMIIL